MTASPSPFSMQKDFDTTGNIAQVYQNTPLTLRLLSALGWGGELLNLGYFLHVGAFKPINLVPNRQRLAQAQQRLVQKSVSALAPRPNDKVLDIACGRGYATNYIASHYWGTKTTGLDLLAENIDACKRKYGDRKSVSFVQGDACNLPFPSQSFDKILCLEAAFHFSNRPAFLAESHRTLKDSGNMLLVDFMWQSEDRSETERHPLVNIVKKTWAWQDFSSVSEYDAMLKAAGFSVVQRYDWTKHVTAALQWQFNFIADLARTRLGRLALAKTNPALRHFTPKEWREIRTAAKAHAYVNSRSVYVAVNIKKI